MAQIDAGDQHDHAEHTEEHADAQLGKITSGADPSLFIGNLLLLILNLPLAPV